MKAVALHSTSESAPARKLQKAVAHPVSISPWFPENVSVNEGAIQRKADCACGGGCPRCAGESHHPTVQTKLAVSTPGDQYEQEADRVAEQVMRMPETSGHARVNVSGRFSNLQAQRKCAGCADSQPGAAHEDEENLQSKEIAGQAPYLATKTQSQIDALRVGGGQPLPSGVRAFFEPLFGYSFGSVRVHADARAAESAQAVRAQAYTVGHDVVFGPGRFAPETDEGRRLLAHELTHVVQQSGADGISLDQSGEKRDGRNDTPETRSSPVLSAVHTPALQRQEAELEPTVGNSSGFTDAEGSAGEAQPAGIWDRIFGKDHRVECAHQWGACNITCRSFPSQSQAYERCMTCCKTGYDICLDTGAFVTPEGGCARG